MLSRTHFGVEPINNLNKNFIDEEVCNLFIDYYVSVKVLVPFINLKNILKYPGKEI